MSQTGFKEISLTLLDVLKLIRHYLKLCVAIVITCALLGGIAGFSKSLMNNAEYSAEAILTVSEPTATVSANELMPLVQAVANNVVAANERDGVSITQKYDLASRSITFTAATAVEGESIRVANDVASQTAEQMRALLVETAQQYRALQVPQSEEGAASDGGLTIGALDRDRAAALETVSFAINDASQATINSGKSTLVKFVLVGLLGGLVLAACVVIAIDLVKAPIKGRDAVEDAFGVSVLVQGHDGNFGQRLWANIQFAVDAEPQSICLVPVCNANVEAVATELQGAMGTEGIQLWTDEGAKKTDSGEGIISITACAPLSSDVRTAFKARQADATVVVAESWLDSMRQANETLRELSSAEAKVVGVALVTK